MAAFDERDVTRQVQVDRVEKIQQIILDRQEVTDVDGNPQPPLRVIIHTQIREGGREYVERSESFPAWPPSLAVRNWLNSVIDNAESA